VAWGRPNSSFTPPPEALPVTLGRMMATRSPGPFLDDLRGQGLASYYLVTSDWSPFNADAKHAEWFHFGHGWAELILLMNEAPDTGAEEAGDPRRACSHRWTLV
jgi:hypothetical protein